MSHLNLIRKKDYPYAFDPSACEHCEGRCCTGESGNIFVSQNEIAAIMSLLGTDIVTFVNTYLVKKGYKFSLKETRYGDSYDCIFYSREAGECSIYDARPQQCRTFPFWDYFKQRVDELKAECPGIVDD